MIDTALPEPTLQPDEILVLDLQAARGMLFTKRTKVGKTYDNALKILEEAIPTILVRGFTVAKLGNAFLADQCGLTAYEAKEAKKLLSRQGIITLVEMSVAGKSVATWRLNDALLRVEKRKFKNIWSLRYYWQEALGAERADRLWDHCYEKTDPRRTPKKLLVTARTLNEDEWVELKSLDRTPVS
ncbi:hypothetical protein [Nocardioides sp. Root140]|uniref:hypothetical protein n=1 Tax=Nocardioides sp. Root140 TaxID=1736460 RepID=UPI0006F706DC|nr:hypothetical protein [Nocardioides sp. Root140]KQY61840.1 hypothetical protein ASD30_25190 [Nocardioides sp. Root140]